MAFPLNQVVRVSWYFALDQHRAVTTRYFRVTGSSGSGASENDVAARMASTFDPLILPCVNGVSVLQGVVAERWPLVVGSLAGGSMDGSSGTATGDALPPGVSGKVLLFGVTTTGAGRRGFMFIPYPAEGDNAADATPSAAYRANLDALATRLTQNVVSTNLDAPPTTPTGTTTLRAVLWHQPTSTNVLVTSGQAALVWSTQRRRAQPPFVNFSPFG